MQIWDDKKIKACQNVTQLKIETNQKELKTLTSDFGHFVVGGSVACAKITSANDVEKIIHFANEHELPMTSRGLGLSQYGQSLAPEGGMTLDFSMMNHVEEPDLNQKTIIVAAGANWRDVITKTIPHGFLPEVVPLNLNLTVGGVLSVGGVGANSHQAGPIIRHVTSLDVISGSGERIECNLKDSPELFHATLGGLGRFSVIHTASIKLREYKPNVRTFYLIYDDYNKWLEDQKYLKENKIGDYFEAFCSPSLQGFRNEEKGRNMFAYWLYPLQIAVEYDKRPPEAKDILSGLNFWKHIHTEDDDIPRFKERYEPRFAIMRQTGGWDQKHPWIECLLPFNQLIEILPYLLERIPLALGGAYRIFFLDHNNIPEFFMLPHSDCVVGLGILPIGVPGFAEDFVLKTLEEVNARLINVGGKRYLSGWLNYMDKEALQKHFGSQFNKWMDCKNQFDPQHVLTSKFFQNI